jgi:hypothetical protein
VRGLRIGLAAALVLVGVLGVVGVAAAGGSVRDHLDSTYRRAPAAALEGAESDTLTYTSPRSPRVTADEIAGEWRPADRLQTAAGIFLRYSSVILAITPGTGGTSLITVDPSAQGYRRWFGYVGGRWGRGGGFGEDFRGGGPGVGK